MNMTRNGICAKRGKPAGRKDFSKAMGLAEGIAKSRQLNKLLLQAGRLDDLKQAAEDEKFCLSLYEEFHIL